MTPSYPLQSWYVVAVDTEVTSSPLGVRALDTPLVVYRTAAGRVAVLEDRDAHRPYPLSLGRVEGELLVSSYSGFAYAEDGRCVRVPTQAEVPYGARVRAFPVRVVDGLVWVWFGEPGTAGLHLPPRAPWLADAAWATVGDGWTSAANFLLLHENLADITHVAVVDPALAPPVLRQGVVPPLDVEVTETTVALRRSYPAAPLAGWHADVLAVGDERFRQVETGRFVSPALWVDSWDVVPDDGRGPWTFRFTHAITPVDATSTRHVWRVSRNFAASAEVSADLTPRFRDYYRRVRSILETMQAVLTLDGPRDEVAVAADEAARQVRRIVTRMVAEQSPVHHAPRLEALHR